MNETTFFNVTITIPGDPKAAYTRLCDALAAIDAEWQTDTFSHSTGRLDDPAPRSTEELFPDDRTDDEKRAAGDAA